MCNDPWAASRCYQEAVRLGLTESMLGLGIGGGSGGAEDASTRLVTLAGAVDEKVDGLVIMAADGVIMMINMVGGWVQRVRLCMSLSSFQAVSPDDSTCRCLLFARLLVWHAVNVVCCCLRLTKSDDSCASSNHPGS